MITKRSIRDAALATAVYAALTVLFTWPLVGGLAHDVPSDFGDPLLNTWIVCWDADHLLRALAGRVGALGGYWNANIFYPHPLSLAYSEHLTPQAIEILPVYALTGNPILCYNLLFLSTFVLSGLGMFLFARELTGSRAAAFVAGLAFAFAPYRVAAMPHVQVLSSMWMPFALLGFRRYFETRRLRPLALGAAAWALQNLSCGYYLLYFSPILLLYLAWEITTRALWRDWPVMLPLIAAALVVAAATAPFLMPYAQLRAHGFSPRSLTETDRFGADVYSYLTAHPDLLVWGAIARAFPKAEGELFPGLTILALALTAVVRSIRGVRRAAPATTNDRATRIVRWLLAVALFAAAMLLFGWTVHLPPLKITSFDRALLFVVGLATLLVAISPTARQRSRLWAASPVGIFTLLTLLAVAMSFGPHVHAKGRLVEEHNVYAALFAYVPGYDGLRVPARFAMIVALGLATLASFGTAALDRRFGRRAVIAAGALMFVESLAVPIGLNGTAVDYKHAGLAPLPPAVGVGSSTPEVYRFVGQLPRGAAVVELPLGEPAFDVRYMFYSAATRFVPLVNGYSGGAPDEYGFLTESLFDALKRPDRAWSGLVATGATHVIVHEGSYAESGGDAVSAWLRSRGAEELAAFGRDRVFALRHPF